MLKKFLKTKLNVSTDYLIISAIIGLGMIVTSTMLSVYAYRNNVFSKEQSLREEAAKAENIVAEIINEHHWQIRSLADKIMKAGNNLEKINQIITNHNKFDRKSNFDQFLNQKDLFWVDANDNLVIKNKVGILKYPQKITKAYEVFNAKEDRWKLIISKTLPYHQNGYSLILTSFGVTDSIGNYIGSIVSSIDVHLIQNLLIKNLSSNANSLIVLGSDDNKIIFQTDLKNPLTDRRIFTYKLGNINYDQNQGGPLENSVAENGIKYGYYKKITNYPLVILSGYDYYAYKSQLYKIILKTVYPNIVIGFLLIISLLLFYRRIVQPINSLSVIARKIGADNKFSGEKFPKKINSPEIFNLAKALLKIKFQRAKLEKSNLELIDTKNQLEEAIDVIKKSDLAQIEIIKQIKKDIFKNTARVFQVLNMLKHNLESQISPDKKLNLFLINSLEQNIANITKFATDELNKEFVDIHYVINRAIVSQEKEIKIRNIKLEVFYSKKLPKKIFIDQIRLVQIISSILHKTIVLLAEENTVKIFVKTTVKNKKKNLSIRVEDDGVGIGFKEHINETKKFGGREESAISGIDISVETIEELVALHQGEIIYNNRLHCGSNTTIILPCIKQIRNNLPAMHNKITDNIVYFPVRNKD